MNSHTMQVDILTRALDADSKTIHIERAITLQVVEHLNGVESEKLPAMRVIVLKGEVWFQDGFLSSSQETLLPLDYTLYTTSMKHWDMSERSEARTPRNFAALHSETSRAVGYALYEFGWHSRSTLRAHESLSFDRFAICDAASKVADAEKALLNALPFMSKDKVTKLVDEHFKTLADGMDPARILTNLPTDLLG